MRTLLRMDWRDVLVASWPVAPDALAGRLPPGLSPDLHDGSAWLSVVAFEMAAVRPAGVPARLGRSFPELNLRTYVDGPAGPGIYFFNLDADDALGVALARAAFGLPYYYAEMRKVGGPNGFEFASERRHPGAPDLRFDGAYAPEGEAAEAEADTLAHFLLERYRFYEEARGALRRAEVEHPPWPVQPAAATFRRNDLFAANGFDDPDGDPHLAYSDGVPVEAGRPHRA